MILADKILELRKKAGYSQEELAAQLGVSRQSVSKWEQAQSIPEMDKIIKLSDLFEVSIDYLLKDNRETIEYKEVTHSEASETVSLEKARGYLTLIKKQAPIVALAASSFIISPITLLLLSVFSAENKIALTENTSAALGMIVLFTIVAIGVGVMIHHDHVMKPYKFLETQRIETEYGVSGLVKALQQDYQVSHTRYLIVGVLLCVTSVLPIFISLMFSPTDSNSAIAVSLLLSMVALGVYFLVRTSMINNSFDTLLQEGDYSIDKKESKPIHELVSTVYWLIVVSVYLGYSFISNDWGRSWIIFPVTGVLFGAISAIVSTIEK